MLIVCIRVTDDRHDARAAPESQTWNSATPRKQYVFASVAANAATYVCMNDRASDTLLTQMVFLSLNLSSKTGTNTLALELNSFRKPLESMPTHATASDTTPM